MRGANHQIVVQARVVYIDEHRGAGLELIGFSPEMKAQLAELEPVTSPELELIEEPAIEESPYAGPVPDEPAPPDDDLGRGPSEPILLVDLEAIDDASDDFALPDYDDDDGGARDGDHGDDTNAYLPTADLMNADTEPAKGKGKGESSDGGADGAADGAEIDRRDQSDPGSTARTVTRNVQERLRGLTLAAQLKLAVTGELHERVALERMYGKNVWETLLRNPRLTPPEVSRIARYGSLPRVLLEIIVGNNTWLQIPEVRRAVLSNPRLGADQIMKVLRLTPKHELKLAAIQTAYPYAVRSAAKLMILRDE